MLVARILGGLGNQLFQYAYGRYLANRHQSELYLDISGFEEYSLRQYQLDRFRIAAQVLPANLRNRLPAKFQDPRPNWLVSISQWPGRLKSIREKGFGFKPWWLRVSDDSYLRGYWQSDQAFPGIRGDLLNDLQLLSTPQARTQRLAEKMKSTTSLAVHVRRGDYANNPIVRQTHRLLDLDYYHWCIQDFLSRNSGVQLYVFSDDLTWCRANLSPRCPVTWVDHTSADTAFEDLYLMTQAHSCVIANSTFSWWGAWLNDNASKIVYSPQNWFQPQTLDSSGLLCDGWIAVDSADRVPVESVRRVA